MSTILGNPITVGGSGKNVIVSVSTGAVVTAKNGNKTVTATSVDGAARLRLTDGEWTLTATKGDYSAAPVTITVPLTVVLTLNPPWLVLFDGSTSAAVNSALTLVDYDTNVKAYVSGTVPDALLNVSYRHYRDNRTTLEYAKVTFDIGDYDQIEFRSPVNAQTEDTLGIVFGYGTDNEERQSVALTKGEYQTYSLAGHTGTVAMYPYDRKNGIIVGTPGDMSASGVSALVLDYLKLSNA